MYAIGIYNLKPAPATVSSPLAMVVVDESVKPTAVVATTTESLPSPKSRLSPVKGKARTSTAAPAAVLTTTPVPPEWKRGGGATERGELAKRLGEESRGWLLGFVEQFLDADMGGGGRIGNGGLICVGCWRS